MKRGENARDCDKEEEIDGGHKKIEVKARKWRREGVEERAREQ